MINSSEVQRRFELYNQGYWEIPDNLDTTDFDFNWRPDPWDRPYIHQFGTQHQKTGGPRFIVPEHEGVKYRNEQKAIMKPNMRNWRIFEPIDSDRFDFSWHPDDTEGTYDYIFGNEYHTPEFMPTIKYRVKGATQVKYVYDIKAPLKIEKVKYTDSIFDSVINHKFETKYACFQNDETNHTSVISKQDCEYIYLCGDYAIVPNSAKSYLYDNLRDYPYIEETVHKSSKLLDIIFFSNGESCAEENYQRLLDLKLPNRVVHIKNVQGRVASQHAAANASNTEWYFLVNAKLKVNPNFDFTWQPDIFKSRRHYIFKATNPVNGLEYGHMAIVANNKKLTLETKGYGLDFTMESPTEVVDMNCGTAIYNSSEWDAWRTSFREVIKLCYAKDVESKNRLEAWLNIGNGEFAQYSLRGAKDAVDYYNSVNGELDKLKLSYEWAWLREIYNK